MAMCCLIRKASPRIVSSFGKRLDYSNFSTVASKLMPEPPLDFPFVIEDIPGKDTIKLTRDLAGEKIIIEASHPDYDPDISLEFKVSEANGARLLDMSFVADSHGFFQNYYIVYFREQAKQYSVDAGLNRPEFWTEFIRARGVGDSVGGFLYKYMTKRKGREHLLFLKKFREFAMS